MHVKNGPKKTAGYVRNVKLSKLATHEDPYHVHKILGVLSLLHFIYRYAYVLPATGTLGFEGTAFDWVTMTLHLSLSSSSLIFHVIKQRKLKFPMIMWQEYRLHAIIFTLRCWSVFAFGFACSMQPWLQKLIHASLHGRAICFTVPLVHHVLADLITKWHGTPGVTSVRVAASKRTGKVKYEAVKMLYSFYQFIAIASHITPNSRDMDLGFNTLIAIQSSAFLMTLCRKNIITFRTHGIVYSLCLVLSASYIVFTMCNDVGGLLGGLGLIAATAAIFGLRVTLRINKYALWALFTAITFPGIPSLAATFLGGASAAGALTVLMGSFGAAGFAVLLSLLSSKNSRSSGSSSGNGSTAIGLASLARAACGHMEVESKEAASGSVGVADIMKGGS